MGEKELPDALDDNSDTVPVDGATRHRYDMVVQELRDLATRTYVDMRRCGNVRPTADILSPLQGSQAMNLRSGFQDDSLVYEKELPIIRPKKKAESSCAV